MSHIISLAAGVVQEFEPERVVRAAAEAGFDAAGLWFDAKSWTPARTVAVRDALAETQIQALDIEVAGFAAGAPVDAYDAIADVGVEVGARHLLVVSGEPDLIDTKRRIEHLCRRVEGSDLRVVLEFFAATAVKSLDEALDVITDVRHPAAGVLVDALHFQRTGASLETLSASDPQLFPYFQICDAPASAPEGEMRGLLDEAVHGRLLPGEGDLPLDDMLDALPKNVPLSVEVRSRALAEKFPDDIAARGREILRATREFLAKRSG